MVGREYLSVRGIDNLLCWYVYETFFALSEQVEELVDNQAYCKSFYFLRCSRNWNKKHQIWLSTCGELDVQVRADV